MLFPREDTARKHADMHITHLTNISINVLALKIIYNTFNVLGYHKMKGYTALNDNFGQTDSLFS
jgi:hypothetical protein